MFKIVSVCKGEHGYVYCRTEPLHPKPYCKTLYPLHRVVMENYLGRLLDTTEIVHHIDRDKTNNDISNLQLVTEDEHRALHANDNPATLVELVCPTCSSIFYRAKNRAYQFLHKGKQLYCSRSCYKSLNKCNPPINDNTIHLEIRCKIKELHAKGGSSYSIAKELGIARNTVMKYW